MGGAIGNETNHLKAIAFTAGFHFAFIEQGGTQPLSFAGSKGERSGSFANPAQYRPNRDIAFSDLA